jgi:23S rRNA pseudouridine1911/1915/1917 synthase
MKPRGGTVQVVESDAGGVRLDRWLADAARLGSRRRAADALLRGRVWVNEIEQTVEDGARRLNGGERVRVWEDRPHSASRVGPHRSRLLDIVFEDADLLVLDKPPGLLTVPLTDQPRAESLADRVQAYWRSHGREPLVVHRLDRDTSGLVVFARTQPAYAALKQQFAHRTPTRIYVALVHGMPSAPSGRWRTWLTWDARTRTQRVATPHAPGASEAVGEYRTLEAFPRSGTSLLEVRLITGKRHQIRVQAWLADHPLIGERIYTGVPAPPMPEFISARRQALHATRLEFSHPRTGEPLRFERDPPADFAALLAQLRNM